MDRRAAMKRLAAAPWLTAGLSVVSDCFGDDSAKSTLRVATFSADITPALGTPLCGGWIKPVEAIDDPLKAVGIVLLGGDRPIVLCALDWVENNNSCYDLWRKELAAVAGTEPSHVAVQCVHPHNAPWADLDAHQLAREVDAKLPMMDPRSFRQAVRRTAEALAASLHGAKPITHIGTGQGKVEKVASTRRVMGPDGKVAFIRLSRCKDPAGRAAPEGTIDPFLKTLSFWNGDRPVVAMHYYATHPMSYYGDGRVSCDFCGLARQKRQQEQPEVFQMYFTGCAGDVTAGKYNDGSPEMRPILRDRIHAGMVEAWEATRRERLSPSEVGWSAASVTFPSRTEEEFSEEHLRQVLQNPKTPAIDRWKSAVKLSWLGHADRPVEISCLRLGDAYMLHLPGEPFIQYQLFAQRQQPNDFVCVAGYGNGGMGYIPTKEAYAQGGYEPTMSFVGPETQPLLEKAMRGVLGMKSS